jgi:hypothetical protein
MTDSEAGPTCAIAQGGQDRLIQEFNKLTTKHLKRTGEIRFSAKQC